MDEELTLSDIKTMEERLSDFRAQPRFRTILLSVFAGLALVLAALGIYGLLTHTVIRRTKEIGIRLALGETRSSVIRRVLWQALSTVLIGIVLGLLSAVFLARLIAGMLYDLRWNNPFILVGVSAVLLLVSLLASYLPARRTTAIDPLAALRRE